MDGKSRNPFRPTTVEQWEKSLQAFWNPAEHNGETLDQANDRWAERGTPISGIFHEIGEQGARDNGRSAIVAAFGEEFMLEVEAIEKS